VTNKDLLALFNKKNTRKKRNSDNPQSISRANRGMDFENDINISNDWYRENNLCSILKRTTPIKVLKMDSKEKRITSAVFEKQSTADYNGVFRGRYIDFEAKSTMLKSSLPLDKIKMHQVKHLKEVIKHGGIAFYLINFSVRSEIYLIDCTCLFNHIESTQCKSISYDFVKTNGHLVNLKYVPRIDYLEVIKTVYF